MNTCISECGHVLWSSKGRDAHSLRLEEATNTASERERESEWERYERDRDRDRDRDRERETERERVCVCVSVCLCVCVCLCLCLCVCVCVCACLSRSPELKTLQALLFVFSQGCLCRTQGAAWNHALSFYPQRLLNPSVLHFYQNSVTGD